MGRTASIPPPRYPGDALPDAAWLEEQRRLWEEMLDRLAAYLAAQAEERHDDRDRDRR